MKPISTKAHGYLDYIVGILLIGAPWILDFARGGAETWVPVILGTGTILYSLLTDYELGITRVFTMRMHLFLDVVAGLLLAASPWLFGFADYIRLPHLVVGIMEILIALLTRTAPLKTTARVRPVA
ncbi:MAG: SPW repeat domain-containing protein [Pseudobacter sp.]|uniref:SPW repeat domain-containing protein n=1 Tax=Pseudobacter sp. TaxID=2045420 RepID=UPI003F809DD9